MKQATQLIDSAWEKQLLNYLRAAQVGVGILFNFGPKAEFKRYIFQEESAQIRVNPRRRSSVKSGEVS